MKNKNDPFYLNFLKKEAAEVYPTKDFNNDIDEEKAWLVIHLDTSKFNTLNPESENYLKTGYSINQDNVYINEKGEIGSYSRGIPAEFNGVLSRMYRDNNEKEHLHMIQLNEGFQEQSKKENIQVELKQT
ncbi:hypothetical protein NW072_05150 [Mycoplasmopsis felis]|uniref:hypothetical protein n=1 Tax=Mycoplasmopsis felis TaxID=33923 RepID=UPI0021AE4D0A|nr:hypothetical protein [Mycoplasmopsis felis]UWV79403.1 hypothetical protein NW072_05150 [Mycoplasmopsis felis]